MHYLGACGGVVEDRGRLAADGDALPRVGHRTGRPLRRRGGAPVRAVTAGTRRAASAPSCAVPVGSAMQWNSSAPVVCHPLPIRCGQAHLASWERGRAAGVGRHPLALPGTWPTLRFDAAHAAQALSGRTVKVLQFDLHHVHQS